MNGSPRVRIRRLAFRFQLLVLGCLIVACAVWAVQSLHPHYSNTASLEVWMLDVGQGESVLVKEPSGKKILFDGGPDDSVLSELGTILPIWDRTIDLLVISHNHSDHIRGLIPVLERYNVQEVWLSGATHNTADYQTLMDTIRDHHIPTQDVYFDQQACTFVCPLPVTFGDSSIQTYHPLVDSRGTQPDNQHDATVSIKVTSHDSSIFLTGDLDEGHEKDMIQACKPPVCALAATALQIPHHGSASGLSEDFLSAVHPQIALIPVGLNNSYHHPRPEIITKLKNRDIPIYRTDLQGQIHVIFSDASLSVTTNH